MKIAAALAAGLGCLGACAPNPYRTPAQVSDYEILVPGRDTLGRALTVALQQLGMRVRRQPRGGGPPPATLVYFTYGAQRGGAGWLAGRVYNARSGRLLAAATLALDSVPLDGPERARLLVAALLTRPGADTLARP